MKIHRVKAYERWFAQTLEGAKNFEVRKNDRDYRPGDLLEMYETQNSEYTGRCTLFRVAFVLTSQDFPDGIKEGYAVLGIEKLSDVYIDPDKERIE